MRLPQPWLAASSGGPAEGGGRGDILFFLGVPGAIAGRVWPQAGFSGLELATNPAAAGVPAGGRTYPPTSDLLNNCKHRKTNHDPHASRVLRTCSSHLRMRTLHTL